MRSYSALRVSGAPARNRQRASPRDRHSTSITATSPSDRRPKKSASSPQVRWQDGNSPRASSDASAHSAESSASTADPSGVAVSAPQP